MADLSGDPGNPAFITYNLSGQQISSFTPPSNIPAPHDFVIDAMGNMQWNSAPSLVTLSASGVYTVTQGPADWKTLGHVGFGGLAAADGYVFGGKMYSGQGYNGSALVRFNTATGYTFTQSTQIGSISHIALGMNGLIYATNNPPGQPMAGTVQIYNPQTFQMVKEIDLPGVDDLCVTADAMGDMYVGTGSDGLYKLDPTGKILLHITDNAADLDLSSDGKLLAFGDQEVSVYDTNLVALTRIQPPGIFHNYVDQVAWATYQTPTVGTKLVISAVPTVGAAGATLANIVVKIEDTNGDVLTSEPTSVQLILNTRTFAAGSTTSVKFTNGIATFSNLKIDIAGNYSITAKDSIESLISPPTATLVVWPGNATRMIFTSQPTSTTAGKNISPPIVVDIDDAYGNIVTTDTSKVTLAAKTGPGAISGTASVALNNGAAIFSSVSFNTPGTYTLIAQDGSLTPIVSTSFQIAGTQAQYHLVFAAGPTNTPAGQVLNPSVVVYLMDSQNNIIRNDTSKVTLSVASGPGTIAGTTSVAFNNGAAIFSNISFPTAGTYTITAKDGSFTPITSSSFTISPVTTQVAHLVFVQNPTNIVAGKIIAPNITVKATDASGKVVGGVLVTLEISSGPAGGALFGKWTSTTYATGIAAFGATTLHLAGTYTLTASVGGVVSAKSTAFTVSPAAANKLAFTTLPTSASHGSAFTVKVSVEDIYGNILTTQNTGTITLALATHPTGSTLGGTLTANVVSGVATFSNLTASLAGSYSFKATDSFSIAAATSAGIMVS